MHNKFMQITVAFICICALLALEDYASGRGRGGGGGARGGGGGGAVRGGGGGVSRPAGGGGNISRPAGGGANISRPANPINRSPAISQPSRPNIGSGSRPNIGSGNLKGNLGSRDGPGIVTNPIQPGNRPNIGSGGRVDPGFGVRAPISSKGGIGNKGIANRPSQLPNRPSTSLPGLGLGAGAGLGLAGGAKAGDYLGRRQDNIADRRANISDRSQNLQGRLDQRQDYRNQRQENRQDFRDGRREDWQNWHDDYYGHHHGWYHGGWCNHWGGYWGHMWSEHTAAMVLGTTWWGLNRMSYWFGYGAYENPYYTEPLVIDNTTIYYSEPLVAAPPVDTSTQPPKEAELPPGVTAEGMKYFDQARAEFYKGNFKDALASTNKALASMPKDAVIHEFRALVLFSMGNYKEAAATLHPVLAVGPGWDWTTMSSLYPGNYTPHFKALEQYVTDNPKSADAHFLLAYHYVTLGHVDFAVTELKEVLKLVPNDTVAKQMLQMLGKSDTPPPPSAESDTKIDVASLLGTWNATARGGKAHFEMTLDKDKNFTWTYQEGKTKQAVKGAYALSGNVLALEPDAGGVMLAEITEPKGGSFVFRIDDAPKSDPGLTFKAKGGGK
jgi:Tetratricopeptide repeat